MPTTTKQFAVPLWHYSCPECGMGDEETGYHAPDHVIYCEICIEDGQHVRLRRWQVEHGPGAQPEGG